jgi:hypothetical protein
VALGEGPEFKPQYCKKGYNGKKIVLLPMAHAYNPSCSGGRDQEDYSSKPAWVNILGDPISKKPFTKKGWWSDSKCRPEFKCHHQKKKKKKKKVLMYFKCEN